MTHTTPFVETADSAPLSGISPVGVDVEPTEALRADEIRDFVRTVIARYGAVGDSVLAMRRPLLDYGVGVLALIDIVMDVEARFAIELDPDEILSWISAADVVETVGAALSVTSLA